MAQLDFDRQLKVLHAHPDYGQFELGVPPKQAFRLVFGEVEGPSPAADVFEIVGGRELVIRKDRDGRVRSIEIT
jgi:hypothetical protein